MSEFLARVELTGLTENDKAWELYENLHAHMAAEGFSRTITGRRERYLPTGTYIGRFPLSTADVTVKVIKASRKTGKEGRILVVEILDWASKNLSLVDGTSTSFAATDFQPG